jgi:paraquat-inducible protein B
VIVDEAEFHKALVAQGLRAQLQMQSLVTGQLVINMDFFPDSPAKLYGVKKAKLRDEVEDWWEIPTISTALQDLEAALGEIDFKDMADDIRRAMDGIATLATSPELHASILELKDTLIAIRSLAKNMDSKVGPLATSLDQTLVDVRGGIGDARKLMATDIKDALKSAKTALDNANKTLASVENLADEGTQLRHEISDVLKEVAAAARSVRVLADFIEQHPDAVIRGRVTQTGGK